MTNWKMWLHGLLAAFISGGALALTTLAVDPSNFHTKQVEEVALLGGIVGAAAYLKQSPLPQEKKDESK